MAKPFSLLDDKSNLFYLGLALTVFLHHGFLWAWLSWSRGIPWTDLLNKWDAGHYTNIVNYGYQGGNWAFFPFYPLLVSIFARLTGLLAKPQIAGTLLSIILFISWLLVFIWLKSSLSNKVKEESRMLVPKTYWGWLFFLYSPSSFVFHSHHTEALFLLLSYLAFVAAVRQQTWATIFLSGLSGLTRNQGVFVIICASLMLASHHKNYLIKLKTFMFNSLAGAMIVLLFPLYQYWQTGNLFQSIQSQENWSHATSWMSVLKTFWFGNPWQNTELGSLIHHGVYILLIIGVIFLGNLSKSMAIYVGLSLAVIPLQGELVNVFRYGVVLFPVWFVLGDRVSRLPRWQQIGSLVILVALNHMVTSNYALGGWAY